MPQGSPRKKPDYELDAMYQWISCGAEDWVEEADRVFISLDDEMDIIEADLRASIEDGTEIDIRYFRLTHLYNADVQTKTIQTYRRAIDKMINSLAPNINDPYVLTPVDLSSLGVAEDLANSLLFRLDVDDIGWEGQEWGGL